MDYSSWSALGTSCLLLLLAGLVIYLQGYQVHRLAARHADPARVAELERDTAEPLADLIARAEQRAVYGLDMVQPDGLDARWDKVMDQLGQLDGRLAIMIGAGFESERLSQLRAVRAEVWAEAKAIASEMGY